MLKWQGKPGSWRGGLLAALVFLTGCQVDTQVDVTLNGNDSGTLAVTVTLDRAALAEVGNLSQVLQTADLTQTGWVVVGPLPLGNGEEAMTIRHPFANPAQLETLAAQIIGSGPEGSRPFQLQVIRHQTYWHTDTMLSGRVNLTCGLACFGDTGLQAEGGSPVGFNPAPLEQQSGQQPAQVFHFSLTAGLPGKLQSTNATSRDGTVVTWNPVLGQTLVLSAASQSVNYDHVALAGALVGVAGLVVILLPLLLIVRWWWRRRRRRATARREAVATAAALSAERAPPPVGEDVRASAEAAEPVRPVGADAPASAEAAEPAPPMGADPPASAEAAEPAPPAPPVGDDVPAAAEAAPPVGAEPDRGDGIPVSAEAAEPPSL